jgi:AraC family transcriptional regulator
MMEVGSSTSSWVRAGFRGYGTSISILRNVRSELALDGLALALLAQVVRGEGSEETRSPGAKPPWLSRVEALLRDPSEGPSDIASIAAEVDIHPVHLARVFRRHYGCSPGEYLRRIRVRRACALLAESRESLAGIAYRTGYSDQSHFTRHFKRAMGVTPGAYRRLVR